jgi:hypothetical protein
MPLAVKPPRPGLSRRRRAMRFAIVDCTHQRALSPPIHALHGKAVTKLHVLRLQIQKAHPVHLEALCGVCGDI